MIQVRVVMMRYQEGLQNFPEDALRTATFGKTVLDVREYSASGRLTRSARRHGDTEMVLRLACARLHPPPRPPKGFYTHDIPTPPDGPARVVQ